MTTKEEKQIERVVGAAGPLSPEVAAAAAAELLTLAGVSRPTVLAFMRRLDNTDLADLVCQLDGEDWGTVPEE